MGAVRSVLRKPSCRSRTRSIPPNAMLNTTIRQMIPAVMYVMYVAAPPNVCERMDAFMDLNLLWAQLETSNVRGNQTRGVERVSKKSEIKEGREKSREHCGGIANPFFEGPSR